MAGHVGALRDKDGNVKKRKDGTTIWRARYPDPTKGGTAQIEKRFQSKSDGEKWLKRQGVAVLDGTHVDPRKGERLLSEVAAEWRETWTDLEPKTRVGYDSILHAHIVGSPAAPARFHRAKVGGLNAEVYQRFINDLSVVLAPNTVHRINTVLSAVLRLAVQRRYIAVHPGDAVKLPKKRRSKGKMLFLTPGEVRALAEAIDPHYRVAVYVAAWCGFRAGEQWALKREDVDLQAGTIRVDEALKEVTAESEDDDLDDVVRLSPSLIIGSPKSEASHRSIKVPAPILSMLAEHMESVPDDPQAFVFLTKRGKPVRHNQFYKKVFRPVVAGRKAQPARRVRTGNGFRVVPAKPAIPAALPAAKAGLRWHDLRHTAAALSLAVAPNLHVVKERLGHEDIRTTINTYGHLLPSVDAALADGLSALFESDNVVLLSERQLAAV
jgi:integrase